MHRPPAVSYKVVRSRWHFFAIVLATAFAGCGACAFALQQAADWRICALFATLGLALAAALHQWHAMVPGRLHWDGQNWYGPEADTPPLLRLQIAFDFQWLVLVRTTTHQGKTGWIWLERAQDAALWSRLRRALVVADTLAQRSHSTSAATKAAASGEAL